MPVSWRRSVAQPVRGLLTKQSGGFLLLIASLNSSALPPPTGRAEAVGSALGLLTLVFTAVWLIATGLPRNIGLGSDLITTRRRIWLRLVAAGFPVMAISAAAVFLGNAVWWARPATTRS
jgi:hypothetical protein